MLMLSAVTRSAGGNVAALRKNGKVPGVFYGRKEKSTPVEVVLNDFLKVWQSVGESSVFNLKTDKGDVHDVLIQDVDLDPVTSVPRHVDFYVIEKGKTLRVKTPLEFSGVAPAVKDLGGTLVKVLYELEIEALPKDLPHSLVVDISALADFKSQILAQDIKLPAGVLLKTAPIEVVAAVSAPKEEEETTSAPIDLASIEVEKKGKEAKEGDVPSGDEAAPKA